MVVEGLVMEGLVMEVDMVGGRWVDCVPAGRGWRWIGASLRLGGLGGVEVGCLLVWEYEGSGVCIVDQLRSCWCQYDCRGSWRFYDL